MQRAGAYNRRAKGLGRELLAVPSDAMVLSDEAGDLRPGEPVAFSRNRLATPVVGLPEAGVKDPLEGPANEGVGSVGVGVPNVRQLGAFHEGPHLFDSADPCWVERFTSILP